MAPLNWFDMADCSRERSGQASRHVQGHEHNRPLLVIVSFLSLTSRPSQPEDLREESVFGDELVMTGALWPQLRGHTISLTTKAVF